MNPSKDEIKAWLKSEGHTREWLGEQCGGIKRRTVDNWLSSPQEIPEGTISLIARLMAEDVERKKDKADPMHHLILTVALAEFRQWEQAALHVGTTATDYCIQAIREAYRDDMRITILNREESADEKQA